MKKVVSHLDTRRHNILQAAPGQTDGDRVRFLVDFFGECLDARAKAKALAEESKRQLERMKQPTPLELVRVTAEDVAARGAGTLLEDAGAAAVLAAGRVML